MTDKIIPFGKYKGQPIEVLQQDKQYLDWLKNQDWFKRDYQQFNTIIINNFQEPSETPEHNKLQNLFLDDNFCLRFLLSIRRCFKMDTKCLVKVYENPIQSHEKPKVFIPNENTVKIPTLASFRSENNSKPKYTEVEEDLVFKIHNSAVFERDGIDVTFSAKSQDSLLQYTVEVKPSIGDDYPAVLRQMISNKSQHLLIDNFSANGATFEQVREIFKRSHKYVILLSEII